jgi:hypothetical protein
MQQYFFLSLAPLLGSSLPYAAVLMYGKLNIGTKPYRMRDTRFKVFDVVINRIAVFGL